jgi:hypothetical protein
MEYLNVFEASGWSKIRFQRIREPTWLPGSSASVTASTHFWRNLRGLDQGVFLPGQKGDMTADAAYESKLRVPQRL